METSLHTLISSLYLEVMSLVLICPSDCKGSKNN
nr:MAG TPA: hypothetical protein [Bacteriophage sp.]